MGKTNWNKSSFLARGLSSRIFLGASFFKVILVRICGWGLFIYQSFILSKLLCIRSSPLARIQVCVSSCCWYVVKSFSSLLTYRNHFVVVLSWFTVIFLAVPRFCSSFGHKAFLGYLLLSPYCWWRFFLYFSWGVFYASMVPSLCHCIWL